MPVRVTFKIKSKQMMVHGSATCAATIENDTHHVLTRVNSGHLKGRPAIVVNRTDYNASTRFSPQVPGNDVVIMPDLEPGAKDTHAFDLAEIVKFEGPGHFQIQALYSFNGGDGEALSPAVPFTVLPTTAVASDTVPLMGATSNLLFHTWVCRVDHPAKTPPESGGQDGVKNGAQPEPSFELMLSKIHTSRRPHLTGTLRLAEVTAEVKPVLSAPPHTTPNDQWIAWNQEGSLRFVHHRVGQVSPVLSGKLPSPSSRIISPLFLHEPSEEHPTGAAAAFVCAETQAGTDLHEIRLHEGGAEAVNAPTHLGFRPMWAKAAYRTDKSQLIFFVVNDKPQEKPHFAVKLRRTPVPDRLAHTIDIFSARASAIAFDLLLTRSDAVRGVVLAATSREPNAPLYLYPWVYHADTADGGPYGDWSTGSAHRVPWPHAKLPCRCIVRINEYGRICLLLAADEISPWWYYSTDGTICTTNAPSTGPADIVFRYGDDPSIMVSSTQTGYRFMKPTSRPKL